MDLDTHHTHTHTECVLPLHTRVTEIAARIDTLQEYMSVLDDWNEHAWVSECVCVCVSVLDDWHKHVCVNVCVCVSVLDDGHEHVCVCVCLTLIHNI
jgi:hypothetical protein